MMFPIPDEIILALLVLVGVIVISGRLQARAAREASRQLAWNYLAHPTFMTLVVKDGGKREIRPPSRMEPKNLPAGQQRKEIKQ